MAPSRPVCFAIEGTANQWGCVSKLGDPQIPPEMVALPVLRVPLIFKHAHMFTVFEIVMLWGRHLGSTGMKDGMKGNGGGKLRWFLLMGVPKGNQGTLT